LSARDRAHCVYHRALGRLPLSLRRRILFAVAHRRLLNLSCPRTFSEKVNWRIVNDRRGVLAWTCDKQKMKEHVSRLGIGVYVPRTLWIGRNLAELADIELPPLWVLKPNHATGVVHFGIGKHAPIDLLGSVTADWLGTNRPPKAYGEWAYSQAERVLWVEEWLGDGTNSPTDYKFFVFDGRPRYVAVNRNRFGNRAENFYSADWIPQHCTNGWPRGEPEPPPAQLEAMLQIAGAIGSGFDFLRVDLYSDGSRVAFGEVTPYPASGLLRFEPRSFDFELGASWALPQSADQGWSR
jgi:hypothetical protein